MARALKIYKLGKNPDNVRVFFIGTTSQPTTAGAVRATGRDSPAARSRGKL